jgi:PTH1 family peptidyl-tRNA hydrolase
MKFLIVGLGNMGAEYDNTRHNIGFDVVDYLANQMDSPFKDDYLGDLALVKTKGRSLYLLKPSTYMNLSGKAIRYWLQKLKINTPNLLVVVDDINIPFGKIRLRPKGNDGGHNGLKNINALLGTQAYARLRIGIGNNFGVGRQIDFVLGKWTSDEEKALPALKSRCAECVVSFSTIGIQHTMSAFNS